MNCLELQKYIDRLLLAPDTETQSTIIEHLHSCGKCREDYESAMRTMELLQPSITAETTQDLKERIMSTIAANAEVSTKKFYRPWKPVLAMSMAAAVLLVIFTLVRPGNPAYALAQTIEASENLRNIHIRMPQVRFGSVGEMWISLDENGELLCARLNFPATEDGPKDVVWENGKGHIWFKAKNGVVTVTDQRVYNDLKKSYLAFNPKLIVERLYEQQTAGAGEIDIKEPAVAGECIIITVEAPDHASRREVYTVDPDTKLLLRRETQQFKNGNYETADSIEFFDYNEPIDPAVFTLDAPADATIVDQTIQQVGLKQGNLTDNEIAVKVVQTFFESLIAGDYAKAGQMMEGMPAEKMKETFGKMTFVRVMSIGEPTPYAPNQSLRVPCKIEVQKDGTTSVFEPHGPFVRQVYNQPGQWTICGGI